MRSPAAWTTRWTSSSLVMSPTTVTTSASGSSSTSAPRPASAMSTAMTRPPSRAMRDAVARPMPPPAPVTTTVWPAKRPGTMVSPLSSDAPSVGISPPFAARTRASMAAWGSWPFESATSCCSGRPRAGVSVSGSVPPWARRPRMSSPPTGWSSQVPTVEEPVRMTLSFDMVVSFLGRRSRAPSWTACVCTPSGGQNPTPAAAVAVPLSTPSGVLERRFRATRPASTVRTTAATAQMPSCRIQRPAFAPSK